MKRDTVNAQFRGIVHGWAFAPSDWLKSRIKRAEELFAQSRPPTETEQETLDAINAEIARVGQ